MKASRCRRCRCCRATVPEQNSRNLRGAKRRSNPVCRAAHGLLRFTRNDICFCRTFMNPETLWSWQVWAVLSAMFAALTAIFAKVGVEDINPDLATFIRTIIVLISLSLILFATGQFSNSGPISQKSWLFLVLSGLGTGASWLCYFRALKLGPATLVAPIDKLSVVLVALFGVIFLGERPSFNGWVGKELNHARAYL